MKKVLMWLTLITVLTTTLMSGCAGSADNGAPSADQTPEAQQSQQTGDSASEEKAKIFMIVTDMKATYASWLATATQDLAAAEFPEFDLVVLDGENNVERQISHIENCVSQQADMIICQSLDVSAMAPYINDAIDKGIPVCVVNVVATGSPGASNVLADGVQQGEEPAKEAAKRIPENGKVVILLGPSGEIFSDNRLQGYQNELFDKRPDIEILDQQIANWSKDEAMNIMEDWLQRFDHIDGVLSMNDAMAMGAIEAAKSTNRLDEMTYYGIDGLIDACHSVNDGELTVSYLQNAYEQAKGSLEVCRKVLNGEIDKETIYTDGALITKENAQEWIDYHKANGND